MPIISDKLQESGSKEKNLDSGLLTLETIGSQSGIAQVLVLVLLLAGIAIGTYLVQQRTNLLPKAQNRQYFKCERSALGFQDESCTAGRRIALSHCDDANNPDNKKDNFEECSTWDVPNQWYCYWDPEVCPAAQQQLPASFCQNHKRVDTKTFDIIETCTSLKYCEEQNGSTSCVGCPPEQQRSCSLSGKLCEADGPGKYFCIDKSGQTSDFMYGDQCIDGKVVNPRTFDIIKDCVKLGKDCLNGICVAPAPRICVNEQIVDANTFDVEDNCKARGLTCGSGDTNCKSVPGTSSTTGTTRPGSPGGGAGSSGGTTQPSVPDPAECQQRTACIYSQAPNQCFQGAQLDKTKPAGFNVNCGYVPICTKTSYNNNILGKSTACPGPDEGNTFNVRDIPFFGILLGPDSDKTIANLKAEASKRLTELNDLGASLNLLAQKINDPLVNRLIAIAQGRASASASSVNACK
ncbi:hypothetical protein HYW46_04715 [Candidatus Daviesbacteria bacterium]|nr:hypothetical protein [Candidatus Daviesbacteria bacterium]